MKDTGIVRKVDDLGRIVIPSELRTHFNIKNGDGLEISTDGSRIILQKTTPACIFCGNADKVIYYKGKLICEDCMAELKKQ